MRVIALGILFTLLVAGCTSSTSVGQGIVIENFEPDFSNVYSGEKVTFSLKMKNAGSVNAQDVHATIVGLEEWNCPSCRTVPIGGGTLHDPQITSCSFSGLLAGHQEFSTTGEVQTCTFSAIAPTVPQGLPVTYQPAIRVVYSYGSSIVKSINVGNQLELRRIENLGSALPAETTSVTSSPVAININSQGPIRVFDQSFSFPIEIVFSNVGGGTVCLDCANQNSQNWNKLTFTAYLGATEISGCRRDATNPLTLFRGQTNTVTCTARVDLPSNTQGIIQKTIRVESNYDYFVDATSSVTVRPILA